jgi:uncharacterized membrane protein YccC
MKVPKLPGQFSLFRQRGARGFDLPTRFFDADAEARKERLEQARKRGEATELLQGDRERLSKEMRHSWQRQSSNNGHTARLAVTLGAVCIILFFIIKGFGLVQF